MRHLPLCALLILPFATPAAAVCEGNPFGRCAGDNDGGGAVTIDELVQSVGAALDGCATAPCQSDFFPIEADCGNGEIDLGEECDFGRLAGEDCVSQGFAGGKLDCAPGCMFDTSGCTPLRFTDNGDGTVTDQSTGLMWTQHTVDCAEATGPLCERLFVDRSYPWTAGQDGDLENADGPAFTDLLSTLNRCTSSDGHTMTGGLAGHCDWRLPTVRELQTILFEPHPCSTFPCIDAVFGSITSELYWSSTTAADAGQAWSVNFGSGAVGPFDKREQLRVRAVRSVTACGNGRAELGEQCDGADLGSASCESVGFASGTLTCAPGCNVDTTACVGCVADCGGNGEVDVADLVRARAIFLEREPIAACPSADANGDGTLQVTDLLAAHRDALRGCAVAERVPQPNPSAVSLDVDPAGATPDSQAQVALLLRANGATVAAAQAVLALDPALPYRFQSCTGANGAVELQPIGCAASGRCTKAALISLTLADETPLADGAVLFTCVVAIDAGAAAGDYPVTILSPLASDPEGALLATTGTANQIRVVLPTPIPTPVEPPPTPS